MRRRKARRIIIAAAAVLLVGIALMSFMKKRWLGGLETASLHETTDALDSNPDRGFYLIHGVVLTDDMDAQALAEETLGGEEGHTLALLEINLCNYTGGDISDAGLQSLAALFDALRGREMRYIVRFLYDWNGENMQVEPTNISIVKRHMEQTAPIINANADLIYTLQGLFVGNWGEMNGTRYTDTESLRELAACLENATDDGVFLSVRMPMQWRRIRPDSDGLEDDERRLGLFNDGMLGSESDLGTYGTKARSEAEYTDMWRREDELLFQELLCRGVPNGGEIVKGRDDISLSEYIEYLRTLHVSYLNEEYDRRVMDGWAEETVRGGVWDGADGLSYIGAHLGYRFTAENPVLTYRYLRNAVHVSVDLRNVGFAPACFALMPRIELYADGELRYSFPLEGDAGSLWGGPHTGAAALSADIPLSEIEKGDYSVHLVLDSGRGEILLASSGRQPDGGYRIGGIKAR